MSRSIRSRIRVVRIWCRETLPKKVRWLYRSFAEAVVYLAGFTCLVTGSYLYDPIAGWLVAGMLLMLKPFMKHIMTLMAMRFEAVAMSWVESESRRNQKEAYEKAQKR